MFVPADTKMNYPHDYQGDEIVEACKGKTMIFSYLDKQIVGEFWLEDNCPLSLRLADQKMLTGLDVYPEIGLVTFAGAFEIKGKF